MKLRNKRTGEIVQNFDGFTTYTTDWSSAKNLHYTSLTKLNEEWEDYKPAEPLIKDEKIRKAVRAWAEANGYSLVKICNDMVYEPNYGNVQIHFEDVDIVNEDKYGVHTIAELCGEEEE